MPPKSKGKGKSLKGSLSYTSTSSELPAPFSRPPQNLKPFIAKLSPKHVYITSVDDEPWKYKAQIFAVPLLTNVLIVAFILWRIWRVGPYYFKLGQSLMGIPNEMTMNTGLMTRKELGYELGYRTSQFVSDFLIYVVMWPLPRAFFGPSEDENPAAWRACIGFRDREITVRRSRKWGQMLGDIVAEGGEASNGGTIFLSNVRKATSRAFMHAKTGYALLDGSWDLDWRLMILSTIMVDKKELSLDDFQTSILVHSAHFGWVVFEAQDMSESHKEAEGRKRIVAFKDELTAMGKENLFFRWIELIQFESSQPGGFGPERQKEAVEKARAMFQAQGVDFQKFWAKVGGMEGMPGLDL